MLCEDSCVQLPVSNGCKRAHGKGAERTHLRRDCKKFKPVRRQLVQAGHVLDNGNLVAKQNRVDWTAAIARVIDIIRIDADEFGS